MCPDRIAFLFCFDTAHSNPFQKQGLPLHNGMGFAACPSPVLMSAVSAVDVFSMGLEWTRGSTTLGTPPLFWRHDVVVFVPQFRTCLVTSSSVAFFVPFLKAQKKTNCVRFYLAAPCWDL